MQRITFEFAAAPKTSLLNEHISGIIPAGVHSGMGLYLSPDGQLCMEAGSLLTNEGVKIEEDLAIAPLFPGDTEMEDAINELQNNDQRLIAVVCNHAYEEYTVGVESPSPAQYLYYVCPVASSGVSYYELFRDYVYSFQPTETIIGYVRYSRDNDGALSTRIFNINIWDQLRAWTWVGNEIISASPRVGIGVTDVLDIASLHVSGDIFAEEVSGLYVNVSRDLLTEAGVRPTVWIRGTQSARRPTLLIEPGTDDNGSVGITLSPVEVTEMDATTEQDGMWKLSVAGDGYAENQRNELVLSSWAPNGAEYYPIQIHTEILDDEEDGIDAKAKIFLGFNSRAVARNYLDPKKDQYDAAVDTPLIVQGGIIANGFSPAHPYHVTTMAYVDAEIEKLRAEFIDISGAQETFWVASSVTIDEEDSPIVRAKVAEYGNFVVGTAAEYTNVLTALSEISLPEDDDGTDVKYLGGTSSFIAAGDCVVGGALMVGGDEDSPVKNRIYFNDNAEAYVEYVAETSEEPAMFKFWKKVSEADGYKPMGAIVCGDAADDGYGWCGCPVMPMFKNKASARAAWGPDKKRVYGQFGWIGGDGKNLIWIYTPGGSMRLGKSSDWSQVGS